jgi:hypothetical protein
MSLPKDLGLVGQQSNIALAIFFVPYVLFEIPSNLLMKRFQPHIWRMHYCDHFIATTYLILSSFWMHHCLWNSNVVSRLWYAPLGVRRSCVNGILL